MTCGYRGRFVGPKRRWQIQAVIVMAFMNGTAVGRLSSCRHPTGAPLLPPQDPNRGAKLGNEGDKTPLLALLIMDSGPGRTYSVRTNGGQLAGAGMTRPRRLDSPSFAEVANAVADSLIELRRLDRRIRSDQAREPTLT